MAKVKKIGEIRAFSGPPPRAPRAPSRPQPALPRGAAQGPERAPVHREVEGALFRPAQELDVLVAAAHLVLPPPEGLVEGRRELRGADVKRGVQVRRHDALEIPALDGPYPGLQRLRPPRQDDLDDRQDVRLPASRELLEVLFFSSNSI